MRVWWSIDRGSVRALPSVGHSETTKGLEASATRLSLLSSSSATMATASTDIALKFKLLPKKSVKAFFDYKRNLARKNKARILLIGILTINAKIKTYNSI